MGLFTFLNVHVQNIGTKNILLWKRLESFDTGIEKKLRKLQHWAKKLSYKIKNMHLILHTFIFHCFKPVHKNLALYSTYLYTCFYQHFALPSLPTIALPFQSSFACFILWRNVVEKMILHSKWHWTVVRWLILLWRQSKN